jgi:ribosomal-protein-serine acetyltransferase
MHQLDKPREKVSLGNVVLERWRLRDLEPLFTAISESIEHLRPGMAFAANHGRDSVAQYLAEGEDGWERGDSFNYAIRDHKARVAGSAGLMRRIGSGGLEIGYWIHARQTRKGIATQVAAMLSEIGLAMDTVDHVEVRHDEANIASGAIPPRLGFRKLGVFAVVPRAPAEAGRDVHWRLDAAQLAGSPARSLLEELRGPDRRAGR